MTVADQDHIKGLVAFYPTSKIRHWRARWIGNYVAEVPPGCFFDDDSPEPVRQVGLGQEYFLSSRCACHELQQPREHFSDFTNGLSGCQRDRSIVHCLLQYCSWPALAKLLVQPYGERQVEDDVASSARLGYYRNRDILKVGGRLSFMSSHRAILEKPALIW
jgi:hypothetical protein